MLTVFKFCTYYLGDLPMKFLHLADLHLGKRVNGFDLLEDQRYILEQILALCDSNKVDAVVLAGDIYDAPVPPAAACTLLDWFLTQLAARVASDTAMTSYLLDSIKSAYGVSGAVDEDHRQLRILENETNQTAILMNSLLNEVNTDVMRQQQYVQTARNYIIDLNSAIKVGSYGVNNVPLVGTPAPRGSNFKMNAGEMSSKPLFVAKFNKENVQYKEALKRAVNSARNKKPNVMFEVVAVSPANGKQLSSGSAKNNATKIFQDMVNMGVSADNIALAARTSAEANSSEVHIYVK